MEWYEAVERLTPHVVRINTPQGSGTGFLITHPSGAGLCGVATAAHVVDQAHYWEQPIRLDRAGTTESILVRAADRAVFLDEPRDTAVIVFRPGGLAFPATPFSLLAEGLYAKIGNLIGWVGYPAIAHPSLCFFTGSISAWVEETSSYLVDGVAINGVSGGPAFVIHGGTLLIAGVVSAYMPNTVTGQTLPGLAVVRDVYQFHALVRQFGSLGEAKESESPPSPPPQPTREAGGGSAT